MKMNTLIKVCLVGILGVILSANLGTAVVPFAGAEEKTDEIGVILAAKVDPAAVAIEHTSAGGSGFIISPDGYILSNGHVAMRYRDADPEKPFAPAKRITVTLYNEKKYQAKVIGFCKDPDVSLMKIEANPGDGPFPYVELGNSDAVKMGQRCYAYGMPVGLKRTLTAGIISNAERTDLPTFTKVLQTDAAINPGNSGGPLFNEKGEVLGLNTYGGGGQNLGFTVPINVAKVLKEYFLNDGYFRRASLPYFETTALTDDMSKAYGVEKGVLVDFVAPDSPAAQAGLATGDIIIEMNDKPVSAKNEAEYRDFRWNFVTQKIGSTVKFKILRNKEKHITVSATLLEDDPRPEGNYDMGGRLGGELPEIQYDILGLSLKKMTRFTYYLYQLPRLEGVRVSDIEPGSPAAKAGIRGNALITAIDDMPVTEIEQFQKELEERLLKHEKYICLTFARGKEVVNTALKPNYSLTGKKVALLLPEKDSEYYELIRRVFIQHGATVIITSSAKEITLSKTYRIKSDVLITDLKSSDFDALVLVGGKGAESYWDNEKVHSLIRSAFQEKKVIGAIGAASIILINAEPELLKKKITTDEDYSQIALTKKANNTGKDIQDDENIITTTGYNTQIIKSFLGKLKSVLTGK